MAETTKEKVEKVFQVKLTEDQLRAIESIQQGKDVFVGTRTGSGKSLIYESSPVVFGQSAVCVIVSPLLSIMKEQVNRLSGLGFRATYIGKSDCRKDDVRKGYYQFLFGSPEALVGNDEWREIFRDPEFSARHKLTVVDEAHTVYQWGEGQKNEEAFRTFFSKIGELRSLSLTVPLLSLTATASPSNRKKIMKSLCFREDYVCILDSPDKPNIKINVKCIKNNADISDTFEWLIETLNRDKINTPRHVVFCNSIKDCALLYSTFLRKCDSSMLHMFHSKIAEHVKDKILVDMESEEGQIRVLFCTNAAGMGVNFKGLHNIIHYGPPRDLDSLTQQMGRAGRDNEFSNELILYKNHKGHFKKTDPEDLSLIKTDNQCRRSILCKAYSAPSHIYEQKHKCCDVCEKKCDCVDCPKLTHPAYQTMEESPQDQDTFHREVCDEDKTTLKHKLELMQSAQSSMPDLFGDHSELRDKTINSLLVNCHKIFTVNDVMEYATVWLVDTAKQIIKIFDDVFNDILVYDSSDTESD
ncbi:probable ATP-dependent DNA helicase RecS [Saccostrea cucullata]|uniref:probable ATP-dependent DNA helicase RecS n=1 Tax=Saccostrea cuccullata TaxID=36930 RepID=UPI002ED13C14